MKFQDLYKQVFLTENELDDLFDEVETERKPKDDGVPSPDKFDDVEPLPERPQSPSSQDADDSAQETGETLDSYLEAITSFIDKLNSTKGSSLNSLITQLATPGTPYAGIAKSTVPSIEAAARALAVLGTGIQNVMHGANRAEKAPK
jgi:hypothetical protein